MRLPNSKAIKQIYQDDDGYWVTLKDEYINSDMGGHVVNGENWKQLVQAMREVKKIDHTKPKYKMPTQSQLNRGLR